MKTAVLACLVIAALATVALLLPDRGSAARPFSSELLAERADSVLGVFEGRTPCGPVAVEFTQFPSRGCEKIKWQLTLYAQDSTGQPTTFLYEGTRTSRQGSWRRERGTPFDSDAEVLRLTPKPSGQPLSLLMIDGKVLLLLNADRTVIPGDASWSYALNRTNKGAR
jgi:hypothetical protein